MSNTVNPLAGEAPSRPPSTNVLAVGARVGDFEIARIIGEGGFGIVYEAFDHSLQRRVALKEYMPVALASRRGDMSVAVRSEQHEAAFRAGLKSFVNEARLLAQFDHPALVKVYRFWEQNDTAYMVMPLYEGRTLKDVLRDMPQPDEGWLLAIVAPLLDAIEALHAQQCYHRDVAPDNILVLKGGGPLLLDFGAARRIIGDMTQAVTVILKPGYAPIEQYADDASMKQGPWTDIYALCGVLCLAVSGKPPATSVTRMVADPMRPLADTVQGYSAEFLAALDRGLAVRPENRPQTVAEFRHLLGLRTWAPEPATQMPFRAQRTTMPPSTSSVAPAPDVASPPASSPPADPPAERRTTWNAPAAPAIVATAGAPGVTPPADAEADLATVTLPPDGKITQMLESGRPVPVGDERAPLRWPWLLFAGLLLVATVGVVAWYSTLSSPAPEYRGGAPLVPLPSTKPRADPPAPEAKQEPLPPPAPPPPEVKPAPPVAAPPLPTPEPVPDARPPAPAAEPRTADTAKAPPLEAPAVAAVPKGRVVLAVKPWGGVYVNGQPQGVSPPKKNLDLPEGRHTIEIRNTGFPSYTQQVDVKAGRSITVTHTFQ